MKATRLLPLLQALCVAASLNPAAHAAGDPESGQQKFKPCAQCHGPKATVPSQEAAPKLGGQHAEYSRLALDEYASGDRVHAGMQGIAAALTAQDREDIAAYIARFELVKPPIPGSGEPSLLEKRIEVCRSCHGERGNNFTPNTPRLIGQDERYLLKALKSYQDGSRKNPSMAYVVRNLSDDEMAEFASYYAQQSEGLMPLE